MAVNPYKALKDAFIKQKEAEKKRDISQLNTNYNNSKNVANTQFDRAANDAYINYRQSEKVLPERLSAQGLNGGASETANLKLQTAYGRNLAQNEEGRQSALMKLLQDHTDKTSTLSNNYAKLLNGGILDYDAKIAAWDEEERRRKEEEAARQAALAASYSGGGGGYRYSGGGGGYSYSGGSSSSSKSKKPKSKVNSKPKKNTSKKKSWLGRLKDKFKNRNKTGYSFMVRW